MSLETVIEIGRSGAMNLVDWAQVASAGITAVAVVAAVWSVLRSSGDAAEGRRHQTRLLVNDQLDRFHEAYVSILRRGPVARSVKDYCLLPAADRMDLSLVVARQIMVIDLMFEAGDPRGKIWLTFLDFIEGPIWDERSLNLYATRREVQAYIVDLQASLQGTHGHPSAFKLPE